MLPASWFPRDKAAVEAIYNGLGGGIDYGWGQILSRIHWSAWLGPLMVWTVFILLCFFVMICLVNLLSRQWIKNERMNFPLLQVPLLMEDALDRGGIGRFFGNPYLLAGLCLPVLLHTLNGLSFYYPSVPSIPTLVLAGAYFPKQGLFFGILQNENLFLPGLHRFAFLAARQISFSFWSLYLLGALLLGLLSMFGYSIPAAALGVTFGPNLTRPEETQMIGAYGVFFHLYHLAGAISFAGRDSGGPGAPAGNPIPRGVDSGPVVALGPGPGGTADRFFGAVFTECLCWRRFSWWAPFSWSPWWPVG